MNNLFNQSDVAGILERIEKLTPNSKPQWGKMNVTQMLAHCNVSLETAIDKNFVKRVFVGRILGPLFKRSALSEKPFGKNHPTDKSYIYSDKYNLNFEEERSKLKKSITQFFEGGPSKCTSRPHAFFGDFTPDQWSVFKWKHLDHHLRQFGV